MAKGHVLSEEDVRVLQAERLGEVWVTELDPGEISEDQAIQQVSTEIGCGALEIRFAAGGRANLFATEPCSVLVDDELLRQINCTASIVTATVPNFSFHHAGDRVATVKSAPFAVSEQQLETVIAILRERGPILQARPIRDPAVSIVFTDPNHGHRARELFEHIVLQRLEKLGVRKMCQLVVREEESAIAAGLARISHIDPTVILIASTTAPSGPEDAVGLGMRRFGCNVERFLAPVEPGNLLLLGYKEDLPVVSAPGCFRSAKTNVVDLVLPPLLARYRVSGWEIANLGHGGLLG